jgi:GTP-binding protein
MKFIDEAKIFVKAGDGGAGCVSFRREKFVPRGGPDGGNGGKGGDVLIKASRHHATLLDLKYRRHHEAKRGGYGEGGNRSGKDAPNIVIIVPAGTVVKDAETGETLADLTAEGQSFVAAKGGAGGKGNAWFTTATHRTPRYAQEGTTGEERWIKLDLKLLADVGIIGFPNVGKSSFIARVSAARPKIADYPFTTLTPNLGVVGYGKFESFVIADIPGLVEGAHKGMGMGIKFLRHVERTKVLLHMIDISDESSDDAWQRFMTINGELAEFSRELAAKSQVVAVNKIDLLTTNGRLKKAMAVFAKKGVKIFPISAATGEGVKEVLKELVKMLSSERDI